MDLYQRNARIVVLADSGFQPILIYQYPSLDPTIRSTNPNIAKIVLMRSDLFTFYPESIDDIGVIITSRDVMKEILSGGHLNGIITIDRLFYLCSDPDHLILCQDLLDDDSCHEVHRILDEEGYLHVMTESLDDLTSGQDRVLGLDHLVIERFPDNLNPK